MASGSHKKRRHDLKLKYRERLGTRLMTLALDGYYYFEDDEVEDFINKMELRFVNNPFPRRALRAVIWSTPHIWNKIADLAQYMWDDNGNHLL